MDSSQVFSILGKGYDNKTYRGQTHRSAPTTGWRNICPAKKLDRRVTTSGAKWYHCHAGDSFAALAMTVCD